MLMAEIHLCSWIKLQTAPEWSSYMSLTRNTVIITIVWLLSKVKRVTRASTVSPTLMVCLDLSVPQVPPVSQVHHSHHAWLLSFLFIHQQNSYKQYRSYLKLMFRMLKDAIYSHCLSMCHSLRVCRLCVQVFLEYQELKVTEAILEGQDFQALL